MGHVHPFAIRHHPAFLQRVPKEATFQGVPTWTHGIHSHLSVLNGSPVTIQIVELFNWLFHHQKLDEVGIEPAQGPKGINYDLHPRNRTWNCMLFLRSPSMNLWYSLKWILLPLSGFLPVAAYFRRLCDKHGTQHISKNKSRPLGGVLVSVLSPPQTWNLNSY